MNGRMLAVCRVCNHIITHLECVPFFQVPVPESDCSNLSLEGGIPAVRKAGASVSESRGLGAWGTGCWQYACRARAEERRGASQKQSQTAHCRANHTQLPS